MLLAVLYAQGMLAAHACVAPIENTVLGHQAEVSVESMPCHEAAKTNANECLMHCTQANQVNLDQQTPVVYAVADAVLLVTSPQLQQVAVVTPASPEALKTGPPLAIRFCTFRI